MKGIDLYNIVAFATPVCSALFMGIMLVWDISDASGNKRGPKIWLLVFFISIIFKELFPIFYHYIPGAFIYLNWLFYLALFITPVLYYRFLFEITRTSPDERFPRQHYVAPVALTILALIPAILAPSDEQFRILAHPGKHFSNQTFLSIVHMSIIPAKFLIDLLYVGFSFMQLKNYRRLIVHYTSNESKTSLRWIYNYLLFVILLTIMTILALLISRDTYYFSPLLTGTLFLLAIMEVNIAYNTLQGNYIALVEAATAAIPNNDINEPETQEQPQVQKKDKLTKEYFEEYIHTRKPYLNPNLKIVDLVDELEVNRTYISGFINREYNMNFSRYINCCRLEEYHRLRKDPGMKEKGDDELSELVGFTSYRYFVRLENEK